MSLDLLFLNKGVKSTKNIEITLPKEEELGVANDLLPRLGEALKIESVENMFKDGSSPSEIVKDLPCLCAKHSRFLKRNLKSYGPTSNQLNKALRELIN